MLHELTGQLTIVELRSSDYLSVISSLGSLNMPGGIIYDMLHSIAAEKASVSHLVTCNTKHFKRLPLNSAIQLVDAITMTPNHIQPAS